jgi:hypothetical protein
MPAQFVGLRNEHDGIANVDALRISRDGAQVVTLAHGAYFEQCVRGRVYTGVSAVGGIALITTATTGNHPTLWNPSDSGRYVSIIRLSLGWVSGNNAPGTLAWYTTSNTGSTVATAAPIATFTQVAPVGVIGGALDNRARWSPTTNTFTAAPAYHRNSGISLFTGVAATAVAPFVIRTDYDGELILAPGSAISLCSVAATTTAVFQIALVWEEVDA